MKNNYLILGKQLNQSWEQWMRKREIGEIFSIPWNFRFDNARKKMRRFKAKGFCKRIKSCAGVDVFNWTEKTINT